MIKYLILDIDGTFTDGGIYYDAHDNEIKKFNTKDGTGVICAITAGIHPIVLTGRESVATIRRMADLHVTEIYQNIKDKYYWVYNWMNENDIKKEEVGYIGDDVNDLRSMMLCTFIGCPNNAAEDVKEIADYVSPVVGGCGAVRDVIEYLLRKEGIWEQIVKDIY